MLTIIVGRGFKSHYIIGKKKKTLINQFIKGYYYPWSDWKMNEISELHQVGPIFELSLANHLRIIGVTLSF